MAVCTRERSWKQLDNCCCSITSCACTRFVCNAGHEICIQYSTVRISELAHVLFRLICKPRGLPAFHSFQSPENSQPGVIGHEDVVLQPSALTSAPHKLLLYSHGVGGSLWQLLLCRLWFLRSGASTSLTHQPAYLSAGRSVLANIENEKTYRTSKSWQNMFRDLGKELRFPSSLAALCLLCSWLLQSVNQAEETSKG